MKEITNVDSHKLMYHPDRVIHWQKFNDCFPIYVEIGLTNACNHKCIFCALDYLENGAKFIDTSVMISTLKNMAEHGVKSIMFAGEGESTLHKDIGLFVQKAKQLGMDISITTNGVPLTPEKIQQCLPHLSWIRFSVDSGTPENYSKIHGCPSEDFEKLINNIKQCVELKKQNNLNITIGLQFLVIPYNIGEAIKLAERLREIGVDNLQIKPYSHHPQSDNNLIINSEEYNKLEQELKQFNTETFKILFRKATAKRIEKETPYNQCHGLPFFTLIDSKGNVFPCNMFYNNPEFTYGNLYEKSFSDIWRSNGRKEILSKLKQKGIQECRKGCRLDAVNRYLDRLNKPGPHDNFI